MTCLNRESLRKEGKVQPYSRTNQSGVQNGGTFVDLGIIHAYKGIFR